MGPPGLSRSRHIAPRTAPTNSFCRSGLAENWASESFWGLLLPRLALFQPVVDLGDDVPVLAFLPTPFVGYYDEHILDVDTIEESNQYGWPDADRKMHRDPPC